MASQSAAIAKELATLSVSSAMVLVATGARMKMRPDFLEQARESAEKFGNAMPGSTHIIPVEQMVHPSMSA